MKFIVALTATAAVLSIVACGPSEAEIAATKAKATADSLAAVAAMEQTYTVDATNSKVMWAGTMVGVYTHTGTLNIVEGSIMTKGGQLSGGSFVVDMTTMAPSDTNYNTTDHTKDGLVGHLSSAEFFDVAGNPKATLTITAVTGNTATADLTIRGKTNPENITDIVITPGEGGLMKATGKLVFDRQKYDVAWKATMKDMVLQDNIELTVELVGKAQ